MRHVEITITKFVNSAEPGWIECVLRDAHGVLWTFVEKVPVITTENLNESSTYPRRGTIACEVLPARATDAASLFVEIDTSRPWSIETTDGTTRFKVRKEQLVDGEARDS